MRIQYYFLVLFLVAAQLTVAETLSDAAVATATYADKYQSAQIELLGKLVSYQTVAKPDVALVDNPEFTGFKNAIKNTAESFGLEFQDHGTVLIVALGDQQKRVGIVTHGDVQPADPSKWALGPFKLDATSEPGKLIARGAEDDKGPIATALYAMKSIRERNIVLNRRIELMIYLAEESDWAPLQEYIANHSLPDLNVTIDAGYPVVTAEKGWSLISVMVPPIQADNQSLQPTLTQFYGGAFVSQIPENAFATIRNANAELMQRLQQRARAHESMHYDFDNDGEQLRIVATGKSAHSSEPESGVNAVNYLADLLATESWPKTRAALSVAYIHELVGTGNYGEQFGQLAYRHAFMGPMSLAPTLITEDAQGTHIAINIRRPLGKTAEVCQQEATAALTKWQQQHDIALENIQLNFGEPLLVDNAPHVAKLLDVFAHFTGIKNPQPIAIGGSTNAKLLPNAVSFGPAMPGVPYTGHSEHEFITEEQLALNLRMYTAMMIEMGRIP